MPSIFNNPPRRCTALLCLQQAGNSSDQLYCLTSHYLPLIHLSIPPGWHATNVSSLFYNKLRKKNGYSSDKHWNIMRNRRMTAPQKT